MRIIRYYPLTPAERRAYRAAGLACHLLGELWQQVAEVGCRA